MNTVARLALVVVVLFLTAACASSTTVTVVGGQPSAVGSLPPADGTSEEPDPDPDSADGEPGTTADTPIAAGQVGRMGDWSVSLVGATLNANSAIASENMFNEKPRNGYQFVMVTLRFKNEGSKPKDPWWEHEWVAVSPQSGTQSEEADAVLPEDLSNVGKVAPGIAGEGNVAFEVKSSEASNDLLIYVSSGNEGMFFALK